MSLMISPGMRAPGFGAVVAVGAAVAPAVGTAVGAAVGAATADAGSAGRERAAAPSATAVVAGLVGFSAPLIGADCGPDCMNSTLTRIATVVTVASVTATMSQRPHAATSPSAVLPARLAPLRTFPHSSVARIAGHVARGSAGRARRQLRHGPLASPASDHAWLVVRHLSAL